MANRFGTGDWSEALTRELNESSEYRNAAAKWGDGFNGNMLLAFEADATLAEPLNLMIRLSKGECGGAEFLADPARAEVGFVLRAPFSLWKEILDRKTMAATAILTGRLKVEGDKMALLKYTAAHRALIHCVSTVETSWS